MSLSYLDPLLDGPEIRKAMTFGMLMEFHQLVQGHSCIPRLLHDIMTDPYDIGFELGMSAFNSHRTDVMGALDNFQAGEDGPEALKILDVIIALTSDMG